MARPKKPTYEYVEKLQRYRKRIKDADGKYVAIYGRTPEELTKKIEEAQTLIDDLSYNLEYPTLSEYADKWLVMHATTISEGTLQDYRYIIEHFIKKPLGHHRMADITQDDIKLALISASSMSESVYQKTVMLYKMIFSSALESGKISHFPCNKLGKKGGTPPKEKQALRSDQVKTLLDAVRPAPTDAYVFCMVGLYSGLRREEILGLEWKNVVLDGNAPYIAVRTALHWSHNRPVITTELKSNAAYRNVPIPMCLVECLREHKEKSTSQYVFAGSNGEPKTETQFRTMWRTVTTRMVKPHTYTKYLENGEKVKKTITPKLGEKAKCRKYCYTIDFDVSPHILRHTYITNLLLEGTDVKTVQYLAGHEHAKITLDIYSHLTYNKPEDIIDKINHAFSG